MGNGRNVISSFNISSVRFTRFWKLHRAGRLLTAVLLGATAVSAGAMAYFPPASRADEITASASSLRNGWDPNETTGSLSPATLSGGNFGELFSTPVVGDVNAQPIVIGNSVIVATESDFVYSINAATGAVNWYRSIGTPWPSASENCGDFKLGVMSTPVYDPAVSAARPHGAIYMVSKVVPPGNSVLDPAFYVNALDPTTGVELTGWPVRIGGAPTNDPTAQFTPFTLLQRVGLVESNGWVYAAFAGICDFAPYRGYVVGVNASNPAFRVGAQTMWTDESGITDTRAGIWQSGGGLVSDGKGQLLFATGNGVSPAPGPGNKPSGELAESFVRLSAQSDGSLVAKDFFSPSNAPYLDSVDGDLGSGGPIGLPFGTATYPSLIAGAGKVNGLYVLDLSNLGGRDQGPGGTDAAVSEFSQGLAGEWNHPAAFADTPVLSSANVAGANDYVYYVGNNDALRYLKAGLGGASGDTPEFTDVAEGSDTFGYASGAPVVTSNGTDPNSAVVWAVNKTGGTGTLDAYPAVPAASCSSASPCTMSPLWTFSFPHPAKFVIPATDNGRVFIGSGGAVAAVATTCGGVPIPAGGACAQVYGFGSPSLAPLGGASPSSVNFGQVAAGGTSGPQPVTITNTSAGPVTIESVATASGTSPDPFTQSGPYVINKGAVSQQTCTPGPGSSTPCDLQPHDTLTVPSVTFKPAGPGSDNGALVLSLDPAVFPNFPAVRVALSGTATQPGFAAAPSSMSFGKVAVRTVAAKQVTITNNDASAETLRVSGLTGPFIVTGLPSSSTLIPAGGSIPVTIKYRPGAITKTDDRTTLTLTGSAGDALHVTASIRLDGAGVADISPTLKATAALNFGNVPLGHQVRRTITIGNAGNLPAVITKTSLPRVPFGTPDLIPAGLPVTAGSSYLLNVPVTFTPTSLGAVRSAYRVTWTDVVGTHQLSVPLTGTGVRPLSGFSVPPPGGGWTFNGGASIKGTTLSLNKLSQGSAGSAVYSNPVPSNGLSASFTARIGGGTGADGMTFSLLDAARADAGALGKSGAALGYGGLRGVAVTLDTFRDSKAYPSANFVGIATGLAGKTGLLRFAATTTKIPALRTGTHVVGVSVAQGTITVRIDGKKVLSKAVLLPKSVLVGFTAATGSRTDNHVVSAVRIKAGGYSIPSPGGGWSYNGSAGVAGSDTLLTPAQVNEAGSVVYPVALPAAGLSVTFNVQLGGGSGGDGMTFALLNPATATATTVGQAGLMLGLGTTAGVPGLGVILGTDGTATGIGPPADFVSSTVQVNQTGGLQFQRVAQGIGSLTSGTHTVTVSVTSPGTLGMVLTVWLDGVQVLAEHQPTLTPTVRLAFTAGTSATQTNRQLVRNVAIAESG